MQSISPLGLLSRIGRVVLLRYKYAFKVVMHIFSSYDYIVVLTYDYT